MPPVNIRVVYLATPSSGWPKPDLDVQADVARLEKHLDDAERKLGDVKFVGRDLVRTSAQAQKLASELGNVDGVLAFNLNTIVGSLFDPILNVGLPTVLFCQPYSGHDWSVYSPMHKLGKKLVVLATTDYGEIAQVAALMRVAPRLRQTRVIHIGRPWGITLSPELKERFGVEVVQVDDRRLKGLYDAVEPAVAEDEAESLIRDAKKVVEPTRDEILKSSRVYFAMKKLMEDERAQAITITCLGGFPINEMGYPCIGFSKLNDQGLVAACEADMESTLTMLIFRYAFGVPGFISDPVFDTSTNTLSHAHCVSARKMDGPDGPSAPYAIRNHLEDYKGAVLQVDMRVGQPITCAKLVNLDTMLISTGTIVDTPDVDRGCRTKIATKVADARALLDNWGGGVVPPDASIVTKLHRVIFYGDHIQDMKYLAVLTGLKVVREG